MIQLNCPSCGKRFKLADKWAGRAFKCPECDKPVRVPADHEPPAGGLSDDSQLDWDLIQTNAETMAGKTTLGIEPKGRESRIEPLPQRDGGPRQASGPCLLPLFTRGPNRSDRFRTGSSFENLVYDRLPGLLILGGYGLFFAAVFYHAYLQVPEDQKSRTFMFLLMVTVPASIVLVLATIFAVLIVVPFTGLGLRLAAKIGRFELPEDTGVRLLAWFAAPAVFVYGGFIFYGEQGAFIGIAAAFLVSFLFTGLLFRLHVLQTALAWLTSMICGVTSTVVGVFLIGFIIGSVLVMFGFGVDKPDDNQFTHANQPGPVYHTPNYEPPPPPEPEPEDYFDRALYRLSHVRNEKRYDGAKMIADVDPQPDRADEVIAALLAQLYDTDIRVKRKVFEALRIWDRPNCLSYAEKLVDTSDPDLRRMVIEVFVEHGDKRAVPLYAKQLKANPRDAASQDALIAYGADAQPHVLEHVEDSNSFVRLAMLEVIYAVGDAHAAIKIIPLVADRDPDVARLARKTIDKLAPGAFDDVDEALLILDKASFSSDRLKAFKILADTPPEPDDPRIASVAEHLEAEFDRASFRPTERSTLIRAIANWHRAETVTMLLGHIDERYDLSSRRNNAIEVLGEIGDPRAIKPIINWVSQEPALVTAALVKFGPAAEEQVIVALYEVRSEKGLIAAVDVLDKVGTRKCLQHLYKLSRSAKYPAVRVLANVVHKRKLKEVNAAREAEKAQPQP